MATKRWKGAAAKVAQVNTITPANVGVGNTFTVKVGVDPSSVSITFTATAGTVANVTAGLVALLLASTDPRIQEITWADVGTAITATAATAGKLFTQTSSAAGGTATLTTATTTANSGPNVFGVAANWDTNSVPATGDDLYFDASSVSVLYGLDQSAIMPANVWITASFTGTIGLPETNEDGSTSYPEYRTQYLTFADNAAIVVHVGRGTGAGSGRIKLNTSNRQTTLNVYGTSSSADNAPALVWKGTHASNVVNVEGGDVGIAVFGGEAATVATLRVGSGSGATPTVQCGSGVSFTTITCYSGSLVVASSVTTIHQYGGVLVLLDGDVTTLNVREGLCSYQGVGSVTTANVDQGGTLDFDQVGRARSVTTCNLYAGGTINDRGGTVAWTTVNVYARLGIEAQLNTRENVAFTLTYL